MQPTRFLIFMRLGGTINATTAASYGNLFRPRWVGATSKLFKSFDTFVFNEGQNICQPVDLFRVLSQIQASICYHSSLLNSIEFGQARFISRTREFVLIWFESVCTFLSGLAVEGVKLPDFSRFL